MYLLFSHFWHIVLADLQVFPTYTDAFSKWLFKKRTVNSVSKTSLESTDQMTIVNLNLNHILPGKEFQHILQMIALQFIKSGFPFILTLVHLIQSLCREQMSIKAICESSVQCIDTSRYIKMFSFIKFFFKPNFMYIPKCNIILRLASFSHQYLLRRSLLES